MDNVTRLQQFRQSNPGLESVSDPELTYILWERDYKTKGNISLEDYATQIGLGENDFNVLSDISRKAGGDVTDKDVDESEGLTYTQRIEGALTKFFEGQAFGWGSEILAGTMALGDYVASLNPENKRPPVDLQKQYAKYQSEVQADIDRYAKENPVEATAFELLGGFTSPLVRLIRAPEGVMNAVKKGNAMIKMGVAGAEAATAGTIYGAGAAEPGERLDGAQWGGLFGFGLGAIGQRVASGYKNLKAKQSIKRSGINPTWENLKKAKDDAYEAVGKAGGSFNARVFKKMVDDINLEITKSGKAYDPQYYAKTQEVLDMLKKYKAQYKTRSLSEMDLIIRNINEKYAQSPNFRDTFLSSTGPVKTIIEKTIKETLDSQGIDKNILNNAKLANQRFAKMDLFKNKIDKIDTQNLPKGLAAETQYRKIVADILNNPSQRRMFDDKEIEAMTRFAEGSLGMNIIQQIGRGSPFSANQLVNALYMGSILIDPTLATVIAASAGAKQVAKSSAKRGMERLAAQVESGVKPPVMGQQVFENAGRTGLFGNIAVENIGP